ncbi:M48 family metalloprotease [Amycolatopsis pigmentata]|uniref:M48 family metalloprotease n=1 Tax=Amycolatopsis pigmentata TaxID=450801 RepID=A0ABW5G1R4_9PSEU
MTGRLTSIRRAASPAPPWPLFWLATTVVWTFPHGVAQWWSAVLDLFGATPNPASTVFGSDLLRVADLVDLVPPLVIAAAVLTVFGAGLRGRVIESRFRLRARFPAPTVVAITEFARAHLPHVEVLANLNRTDLPAFAYFRTPRKPRLAVFAPLVVLWQEDRAAAEAVLRHELHHCRQGDNALLGVVSPLEFVIRHWPVLFACTVLIPTASLWLADSISFLSSVDSRGVPHTFTQLVKLAVPDLVLMLISSASLLLAAITMPVAASWSAELNADHMAAGATPQAMIDAIGRAGTTGGIRPWLVSRLTHPPRALRKALLRGGRRTTAVAAVACYPLAWLALLGWELVAANAVWLFLRLPPGMIGAENRHAVGIWCANLWPVWLAAAAFALLWPFLRHAWTLRR